MGGNRDHLPVKFEIMEELKLAMDRRSIPERDKKQWPYWKHEQSGEMKSWKYWEQSIIATIRIPSNKYVKKWKSTYRQPEKR